MNRTVRLVVAAVAGVVLGSAVNMGLVHLGGAVIPAPAGADTTTVEGLKASLHLFEPKHFIFPFLAHSLGALVGAALATLLAPGRSRGPAWAVGVFFLLGGVASVFLLPGPVWFAATDLLLAYLPSAWLGHWLVARVAPNNSSKPTPLRGAA
jgi:hypothetical protein